MVEGGEEVKSRKKKWQEKKEKVTEERRAKEGTENKEKEQRKVRGWEKAKESNLEKMEKACVVGGWVGSGVPWLIKIPLFALNQDQTNHLLRKFISSRFLLIDSESNKRKKPEFSPTSEKIK